VSEVLRNVACGDWEGRKAAVAISICLLSLSGCAEEKEQERETKKKHGERGMWNMQCDVYG
jgi:hypothetical protein